SFRPSSREALSAPGALPRRRGGSGPSPPPHRPHTAPGSPLALGVFGRRGGCPTGTPSTFRAIVPITERVGSFLDPGGIALIGWLSRKRPAAPDPQPAAFEKPEPPAARPVQAAAGAAAGESAAAAKARETTAEAPPQDAGWDRVLECLRALQDGDVARAAASVDGLPPHVQGPMR